MLTYPSIDPVALELGPVRIHWYGLMYVAAFVLGGLLARARARRPGAVIGVDAVADLLFHVAIGVIAGGRLGYILFYDLAAVADDPLRLLRIWEGGMSFHGGLIGVMLAVWLYARKRGIVFPALMDFLVPIIPIGLGLGRIGNFINGELWGRPTDLPWGMVYPPLGPQPLHPSQLYQALLEGLLLFVVLWLYSRKPRPVYAVSGLFLLLYGSVRVLVEFVRVPDAHIGYLAFGWLTMGQLLSLPMLIAGLVLLRLSRRSTRS